jgi:hypothetical protein
MQQRGIPAPRKAGDARAGSRVEHVVVRGRDDREQDEQRVRGRGAREERVRGVEEEGEADDEGVAEVQGRHCRELILKSRRRGECVSGHAGK